MTRYLVGKEEVRPSPHDGSCWWAKGRGRSGGGVFSDQLADPGDLWDLNVSITHSEGGPTALLPVEE